MNDFKISPLCPIRFYNPGLSFNNATHFQNPDNRVSTAYNWEGVQPVPYHLPIPKEWPDGQPGIDFLITLDGDSSVTAFYAKLYDIDDAEYADLLIMEWSTVGTDDVYRVFLNGNSGSGVAEGYYTIKIFNTADDSLLLESESILIASWFEDAVPFEYWNFENDFGLVFNNGYMVWSGKIMVPIRMFDPSPTFEKEVYKNDPGVLTTLRVIPQRVFNYDSLPVPVHVAELFQLACSCSELYLDRIKINSEEMPEAEAIEGTNLKRITGKATLVEWNEHYNRERVEVEFVDEGIEWNTSSYTTSTITGNSADVDDAVVGAGGGALSMDPYTWADEEVFKFVIDLTDDAGDSDPPRLIINLMNFWLSEFGTWYFAFRMSADYYTAFPISMGHTVGMKAVYTAEIDLYSLKIND